MPKKDPEKLKEIFETLQAATERKKFRKIEFYEPYPKQWDFHALGKTKRERLLMAGNRVGKCVSYDTLISHSDGSTTKAGILYERGKPFSVLSWNGKKIVEAIAVAPIKKPAEPIVRIWTSDGRWFEAALGHRILCDGLGKYATVANLLMLLRLQPSLLSSISAPCPSIRVSGAKNFLKKVQGWIYGCLRGFRLCDEQLLSRVTVGQVFQTSQDDVPQHSRFCKHLDAADTRHTNSPLPSGGRLSNRYDLARSVGRSFAFLWRNADMCVQYNSRIRRVLWQLYVAGVFLVQLSSVLLRGRLFWEASVYPIAGNQIVSWEPCGRQELYDFTVPEHANYVAAGIVHHNTYCGAGEMAYHLTGLYPKNWPGRKWARPITAWVAGESSVMVRNTPQSLLCGKYGVEADKGAGLIPKDCLIDVSLARGVTDAYDTIQVKHYTDGIEDGVSTCNFKSYEQGRQKFQSDEVDVIWDDEEPPSDIYQEELARIAAADGMVYTTFTPLLGRSDVVLRFLDTPSIDRAYVQMSLDDARHFTAEMKRKTIEGYEAHEVDARVHGVPLLGSGKIFATPETAVKEAQIEYVPEYWSKLWGIDFGIQHPFGAALIAWDKDADIIHVLDGFKMPDALPLHHAARMKPIGADVPVAWPQDGYQRDKGTGVGLQLQYKAQGLRMLHEHATWPDGGNSTEAGIKEMQEREATGRLKYSAHLSELFEERRFYHRKDGLIVKEKDDILSAIRVAIMMKRFAKPVLLGGKRAARPVGQLAKGVDFDVFR